MRLRLIGRCSHDHVIGKLGEVLAAQHHDTRELLAVQRQQDLLALAFAAAHAHSLIGIGLEHRRTG